ncbi:MAG: Uma2 family endonuclease [Cytophagales bacterium]|nr:MAG: Uma2 family endonuclease [Cytophagales bacterium]
MQTLVSATERIIEYEDTGEIIYPSSDGNRMAESTEHFGYITTIEGNLASLFAHRTDVFVAGDLLWYPEEGNPFICVAPDTMVVFGRPKDHRDCYKQWNEDNIAPAVVFEILSKSNDVSEMIDKLLFYEKYGVEEYYLYNPIKERFYVWLRSDKKLNNILVMPTFKSPLLGVTFEMHQGSKLKIFNPDGTQFLTFVEQTQKRKAAEEAAKKAEEAAKKAEEAAKKAEETAEEEKARAEKAEETAKKAEETAEEEKARAEKAEETAKETEELMEKAQNEISFLKNLLKEQGFNLGNS